MGRPLRVFDPEKIYFITNRTQHATCFMKPDDGLKEEIGAVIARGQELHPITLFGYVVMSNHLHLLVQGDPDRIVGFARYVFGNIARRVSKAIEFAGKFWQDRYHHSAIIDDAASRERLSYILAHGVKEGLVARAEEWPGLHCINYLDDAPPRQFSWRDSRGQLRKQTLRLSRLPCWASLGREDFLRSLGETIEHSIQRASECRGNLKPLGVQNVLAMSPFSLSRDPKQTRQPLCHSSSAEMAAQYIAEFRAFTAAYRAVSARYRKGERVLFPPGSFAPPLFECSRC